MQRTCAFFLCETIQGTVSGYCLGTVWALYGHCLLPNKTCSQLLCRREGAPPPLLNPTPPIVALATSLDLLFAKFCTIFLQNAFTQTARPLRLHRNSSVRREDKRCTAIKQVHHPCVRRAHSKSTCATMAKCLRFDKAGLVSLNTVAPMQDDPLPCCLSGPINAPYRSWMSHNICSYIILLDGS